MPIRDSLLDAVGFGGAGQLAHQLKGEGDGTAEAVAGGDAAIHDDFLIVDDGTGQLVLKACVCGGVLSFQQAEAGEDAGRGADGGDLLACFGKRNAGVGDGLVLGEVGRTRDAAGQNDHVHVAVIHILSQRVGVQVDAVAADEGAAAHGGRNDDFDLGAAEKVGHQQGLALLGAVGKKQNSFAHNQILLL